MNSEEVKKALNVDPKANTWDGCGGVHYEFWKEGSTWIYPILKGKFRILIMSGDTDGVIPFLGTR